MSENTESGAWALPENTAAMLHGAYSQYREKVQQAEPKDAKKEALRDLAIMAQAGREKGWTYAELAAACGMTPERLRQIVAALNKEESQPHISQELLDQFPTYTAPPRQENAQPKKTRKTKRSVLTSAEHKKLAELAPIARKTSGSTPLKSPARKATKELSRLIIKYHSRGVIWRDLAEATGLSEGGVRSRAARHGYHGGPPPTIPPYRGTTIYREAKAKKRAENAAKASSSQSRKAS